MSPQKRTATLSMIFVIMSTDLPTINQDLGVVVIPDTEPISPEPEVVTVDEEEEEDKQNDARDEDNITKSSISEKSGEVISAAGKKVKTGKGIETKSGPSPGEKAKLSKQGKERNQKKKSSKKPLQDGGGVVKKKSVTPSKKTKDKRTKRVSSDKGDAPS